MTGPDLNAELPANQPELIPPGIGFAQSALGQQLRKLLAGGSASQRTIADFLLRNQVRVTALGIEEMGDHCAVSSATISRFARDLGFKSFAAMRAEIAATLDALLNPVDKLRARLNRRGEGTGTALESLQQGAANIRACSQALDSQVLGQVVARLRRCRMVYVMGFGLSSQLAGILALHLQPFCAHVVEVVGTGGSEVAAGHLANITEHDVLVVISLPRYSLDAIGLARFASDRQACVVAITDSPASAVAERASHVLYTPSDHPVLPSSSGAALALIEVLAATLMVSNRANVAKAARLTTAISAWLDGTQFARPAGSSGTAAHLGAQERISTSKVSRKARNPARFNHKST